VTANNLEIDYRKITKGWRGMVVGYGVLVAGKLMAAFSNEEDARRHAEQLARQMLMIEGTACLNDGTPAEPEVHPLCLAK
jgi:hypothetical protein